MMGYGLSPDILIVRADESIPDDMMKKIASTCGLSADEVFAAPTLSSIYEVPLSFSEQKI